MKKWYQYRCEEILFVTEENLSKRLLQFLLAKSYTGKFYWRFSYNFADWRCFCGSGI